MLSYLVGAIQAQLSRAIEEQHNAAIHTALGHRHPDDDFEDLDLDPDYDPDEYDPAQADCLVRDS
jgi:hypothetical protein